MKKISWGIIGLGNIANKFADAFTIVDNANLKGIASLNNNKLIDFKKKFKINNEFCFNKYEDLISSSSVDIVYIALPNSLHAKYIQYSINKKKNILVEKPAFTNIKEFTITKDLLAKKKIFFSEAFMYRYLPYFQSCKEIIQNNLLGNVIDMHSKFNIRVYKQRNFFGIKIRKPDYSNRLFNKTLGGGAILDIGCYPLSLSTFINSLTYNVELKDICFENVKSEYCENGVDISSSLSINFGNKFSSKIACSFKDDFNQQTIINFEKGSLQIDHSWIPGQNNLIEKKIGNQTSKIEFKNNKNIYSYQIQNISNQLLNKKTTPEFPSMTLNEIEMNTKLLNDWIDFK
tara:strand:+ start:108 stop:1142 length:1035 start_codon:yes stop_codon:yes gene_type:complete